MPSHRRSISQGSTKVVLAALGGNLAIAVTKFAAFALTGSSAMLTEAMHSLVDTGNQGLLLLGLRRASRAPDAAHPFGYGMELYFWSFVVALMIFALGGAFAVYEGLLRIRHPEPIQRAWVNFTVLGAAMAFEGSSLLVAWREFRKLNAGQPLLAAIHRSKDPSVFAILLEDAAALLGLVVAGAGVFASVVLHAPQADGVASVVIGLLLVVVAAFLANETRSLLTGEAAAPSVLAAVRAILEADPRVNDVAEVLSMHLGPQEILLGVTLDFDDALAGGEVGVAADELTGRIRQAEPRITRVFLRSGSMRTTPALAKG